MRIVGRKRPNWLGVICGSILVLSINAFIDYKLSRVEIAKELLIPFILLVCLIFAIIWMGTILFFNLYKITSKTKFQEDYEWKLVDEIEAIKKRMRESALETKSTLKRRIKVY